ncbi:MAG TPA: glycosyltransferase [Bacteroidia bacterium]|nr:glycosyltransferase [Bacteroidia bacterium]
MKLLILSNMYPSVQKPYSGVFVKNQYEHLQKIQEEKDSISIFYMKRSFTNKIGSLLKYFVAFIRFIPYYFKRYDVIHLHYFFPLGVLIYIYKIIHPKTKTIVTFHGEDIRANLSSKKIIKIFKIFSKKIDFTISVGQDLKKDIETKLNLNVDLILSAGVDTKVFYPEQNITKKYDYIFVGSFIHRKGIDIVIETIKKINNPNISFCFVGSGPFLDAIKKLKENYNVTLFENQTQNQLRTLYSESKFLLFPSRDEPFGLVATESIFCGTPIIVSQVDGLKEQLTENKTGFFATTHDEVFNIITKTYELNDSEYSALVKNVLKANKQFGLELVCEKLYSVYTNLVK